MTSSTLWTIFFFEETLVDHRNTRLISKTFYNCWQHIRICFRFRHHSFIHHKDYSNRSRFLTTVEKNPLILNNFIIFKQFLFIFLLFDKNYFWISLCIFIWTLWSTFLLERLPILRWQKIIIIATFGIFALSHQGDLKKTEIQLNLCRVFSILISFIRLMTFNRVKLGRTVTFMKHLAGVASLIFLLKTLIWNKITSPASNLLNFPELVVTW